MGDCKRKWTKTQIAKYCTRIIGRKIDVHYIPVKKTGCGALAYPSHNAIVYCQKKCDRAMFWHECGHLSENRNGETVSKFGKFEKRLATYWKDKYPKQVEDKNVFLKNLGSKAKNLDFIKRESDAQVWAVKRALELGYTNVAKEIYFCLDEMKGLYLRAGKFMKKQLKEDGIEFYEKEKK